MTAQIIIAIAMLCNSYTSVGGREECQQYYAKCMKEKRGQIITERDGSEALNECIIKK